MTSHAGQLTAAQHRQLLRPLPPGRVLWHPDSHRAYLAGWDVTRTLNRIFGFTGWDDETDGVVQLYAEPSPMLTKQGTPILDDKTYQPKQRWTIVYQATVTLLIKAPDGTVVTHKTGVGVGEAVNQVSYGKAASLAAKAAHTDALKRAATKLGDQFGLSLYNADDQASPVVVMTLLDDEILDDEAPAIGGTGALPEDDRVGADVDDVDARDPDADPDEVDPTSRVLPAGAEVPTTAATDVLPQAAQVAERSAAWLLAARRTSAEIRGVTLRVVQRHPDAQQVQVPDGKGGTVAFVELLHALLGAAVAAEAVEATASGDVTRTPAGVPVPLDCGCNAADIAETGRHSDGCAARRDRPCPTPPARRTARGTR